MIKNHWYKLIFRLIRLGYSFKFFDRYQNFRRQFFKKIEKFSLDDFQFVDRKYLLPSDGTRRFPDWDVFRCFPPKYSFRSKRWLLHIFFVFCMLGETKAALQQPLASASFFSRVILVNVFCLMKRLFRSAFVSIKRSQKQKLERKQKYQRNSVVGIIKFAAKS